MWYGCREQCVVYGVLRYVKCVIYVICERQTDPRPLKMQLALKCADAHLGFFGPFAPCRSLYRSSGHAAILHCGWTTNDANRMPYRIQDNQNKKKKNNHGRANSGKSNTKQIDRLVSAPFRGLGTVWLTPRATPALHHTGAYAVFIIARTSI